MQVNNAIYDTYGRRWWDEDAGFGITSLRYCVNPLRSKYFKHILGGIALPGRRLLDVGCGGGFLSEEVARSGFEVSGIDPSANCIEAAREHAGRTGLAIDYRVGRGEALPFADGSFDIVAACDVLEHVDDLGLVIAEVARTLAAGGVFLFDTVNRTRRSRLVMIKIWQDWGFAGMDAPNAHVWEKFIRPEELSAALRSNGLAVRELKGMTAKKSPPAVLYTLLKIRRGALRGPALAEEFAMRETGDLSVSYMGFAIRD